MLYVYIYSSQLFIYFLSSSAIYHSHVDILLIQTPRNAAENQSYVASEILSYHSNENIILKSMEM